MGQISWKILKVSSWDLLGGRALVAAHGKQGIPIAVRKAPKGLVDSGGLYDPDLQ